MSALGWADVVVQLTVIAAIVLLVVIITRLQKLNDQLIADSFRDLEEIIRLRAALVRAGLFNDVLPPK